MVLESRLSTAWIGGRVTPVIDKLGEILFPKLDWYERRQKIRRVVLSIVGAVLLAATVIYITMQVSDVRFSVGGEGRKRSSPALPQ